MYLDVPEPVSGATRRRAQWVCFGPPLAEPHHRKRLPVGDTCANYVRCVSRDGGERSRRLDRDSARRTGASAMAQLLARAGVPAPQWVAPQSSAGTLGG